MFCIAKDDSKTDEPLPGLLISYDDSHSSLPEATLPPAVAFKKIQRAVFTRMESPSVHLHVLLSDNEILSLVGVLNDDDGRLFLKVASIDANGGISTRSFRILFEAFEAENEKLFSVQRGTGPVNLVPILEPGEARVTFEEMPKILLELAPGMKSVQFWLGCLAIANALVTRGFVGILCTGMSDDIKKIMMGRRPKKLLGKSPRMLENQVLAMWYPAPRPAILSTWLQFLLQSKDYNTSDLVKACPLVGGFYRFYLKDVRPSNAETEVSIVFDDADFTAIMHGNRNATPFTCKAYYDEPSNYRYDDNETLKFGAIDERCSLLISVRMALATPQNGESVWGFGGQNMMIRPFVYLWNQTLSTGCFGPVRSLVRHNDTFSAAARAVKMSTNVIRKVRMLRSDGKATAEGTSPVVDCAMLKIPGVREYDINTPNHQEAENRELGLIPIYKEERDAEDDDEDDSDKDETFVPDPVSPKPVPLKSHRNNTRASSSPTKCDKDDSEDGNDNEPPPSPSRKRVGGKSPRKMLQSRRAPPPNAARDTDGDTLMKIDSPELDPKLSAADLASGVRPGAAGEPDPNPTAKGSADQPASDNERAAAPATGSDEDADGDKLMKTKNKSSQEHPTDPQHESPKPAQGVVDNDDDDSPKPLPTQHEDDVDSEHERERKALSEMGL